MLAGLASRRFRFDEEPWPQANGAPERYIRDNASPACQRGLSVATVEEFQQLQIQLVAKDETIAALDKQVAELRSFHVLEMESAHFREKQVEEQLKSQQAEQAAEQERLLSQVQELAEANRQLQNSLEQASAGKEELARQLLAEQKEVARLTQRLQAPASPKQPTAFTGASQAVPETPPVHSFAAVAMPLPLAAASTSAGAHFAPMAPVAWSSEHNGWQDETITLANHGENEVVASPKSVLGQRASWEPVEASEQAGADPEATLSQLFYQHVAPKLEQRRKQHQQSVHKQAGASRIDEGEAGCREGALRNLATLAGATSHDDSSGTPSARSSTTSLTTPCSSFPLSKWSKQARRSSSASQLSPQVVASIPAARAAAAAAAAAATATSAAAAAAGAGQQRAASPRAFLAGGGSPKAGGRPSPSPLSPRARPESRSRARSPRMLGASTPTPRQNASPLARSSWNHRTEQPPPLSPAADNPVRSMSPRQAHVQATERQEARSPCSADVESVSSQSLHDRFSSLRDEMKRQKELEKDVFRHNGGFSVPASPRSIPSSTKRKDSVVAGSSGVNVGPRQAGA
eukprot:TRINITY_DN38715_c0_g1_i1.p1 TRINITY_DN38715_c0_g1~~TRINITY_DN38715_c0_g1_i1.p1  ORF type:complete len:576 (+),score=126.84 TRINITY_DN38715_c0_g1_i1:112-1839(+)